MIGCMDDLWYYLKSNQVEHKQQYPWVQQTVGFAYNF